MTHGTDVKLARVAPIPCFRSRSRRTASPVHPEPEWTRGAGLAFCWQLARLPSCRIRGRDWRSLRI